MTASCGEQISNFERAVLIVDELKTMQRPKHLEGTPFSLQHFSVGGSSVTKIITVLVFFCDFILIIYTYQLIAQNITIHTWYYKFNNTLVDHLFNTIANTWWKMLTRSPKSCVRTKPHATVQNTLSFAAILIKCYV